MTSEEQVREERVRAKCEARALAVIVAQLRRTAESWSSLTSTIEDDSAEDVGRRDGYLRAAKAVEAEAAAFDAAGSVSFRVNEKAEEEKAEEGGGGGRLWIEGLLAKSYDTEETAVHAIEEDRADNVAPRLRAALAIDNDGDRNTALLRLLADLERDKRPQPRNQPANVTEAEAIERSNRALDTGFKTGRERGWKEASAFLRECAGGAFARGDDEDAIPWRDAAKKIDSRRDAALKEPSHG